MCAKNEGRKGNRSPSLFKILSEELVVGRLAGKVGGLADISKEVMLLEAPASYLAPVCSPIF